MTLRSIVLQAERPFVQRLNRDHSSHSLQENRLSDELHHLRIPEAIRTLWITLLPRWGGFRVGASLLTALALRSLLTELLTAQEPNPARAVVLRKWTGNDAPRALSKVSCPRSPAGLRRAGLSLAADPQQGA